MEKRNFEVYGEDATGDIWLVATDSRETAKKISEQFKADGLRNVRIIENPQNA